MVSFFGELPPEVKKKVEALQEESDAGLSKNCRILGIPLVDGMDSVAVAEAAEAMTECQKCPYDMEHAYECRNLRCLPFCTNSYLSPCEKSRKSERLHYQREEAKQLLGCSGLGKRFRQRTFESFKVTPQTKDAYEACKVFCDNFHDEAQGLKLYGAYGCGKTHLVAAIVHRLAEKGIAAIFVVVPELLAAIRKGFDRKDDSADRVVELAKDAPVLVLDDLGAEKATEWVCEQLYIIINHRYENLLPTIVTTNCSTSELISKIGQRTVSRIIEMTTPIHIKSGDYRIKMAKEQKGMKA